MRFFSDFQTKYIFYILAFLGIFFCLFEFARLYIAFYSMMQQQFYQ